jgi:ribosomal protein S17
VIKITLFQCNNGLSISDIEFNEDNIESLNKINIDQLDTSVKEIKKIFMINEPINERINKPKKIHEQIMPIYLILSNPPQIKLGEVIDIRIIVEDNGNDKEVINPKLETAEPMLYAFHHLHNNKIKGNINDDLCINHFYIHKFESIIYTSEFLKIIKCLIVLKELVKELFILIEESKKKNKENHEHSTNDTVGITINKDTINNIINEIIQKHDSIIHKNDIANLKTLIKEYNDKHSITEELLRGFYHKIRQQLGSEYIENTITKLGIDEIDGFSNKKSKKNSDAIDAIYNDFKTNPEKILTNAINVENYVKIKEDIFNKIITNASKNPTDYENNLININNKIKYPQPQETKTLSLTKNFYVILFIMTYLKKQYETYIYIMHKNKSTNPKMKIELLNTMVGKLQETITNIIAEFEKSLSSFTNNRELESHYDTLEIEYRVFEVELETMKTEANKLYNNYQRAKGGKSRRKREKSEGKYSRKGNRKI